MELAEGQDVGLTTCEGCGDVAGVLTLLVGGVAQAFHDDLVVVDGKRTGRKSKEGSAPMDMTVDDKVFSQDLSQ